MNNEKLPTSTEEGTEKERTRADNNKCTNTNRKMRTLRARTVRATHRDQIIHNNDILPRVQATANR